MTPGASRLLHDLVTVYPIPTRAHALPLVRAVTRIANSVVWFEAALGISGFGEVIAEMDERLVSTQGRIQQANPRDLTGGFRLTRALIGKEPAPAPGPESLRATLLICSLRWNRDGKPRRTALEDLAAAIREVTEHDRYIGAESPVVSLLPRLGAATALQDFIDASLILETCGLSGLEKVWHRHFRPELAHALGSIPVAPTPPAPHATRPSQAEDGEEESESDRPARPIRRKIPRSRFGTPDLELGEPASEATIPNFVATIPERRANPDARRLARYQAQQAIWNGNFLLLTNHAEVLPLKQFRRVVRVLLDELDSPETTGDLTMGMVGLLLQALTGRTARTLAAIRLEGASARARPLGTCTLSLKQGYLEMDVFWRVLPKDHTGATGFFEPLPESAHHFESVDASFRLPLAPAVVHVIRSHVAVFEQLATGDTTNLAAVLRKAARHVADRAGFRFTAGQVRRSCAVHVYEQTRDVALTQLICADSLGQSDAPVHYYAPRQRDVAQGYWSFLQSLLQIGLAIPAGFVSSTRTGAASLPEVIRVRRLAAGSGGVLNKGVAVRRNDGEWRTVHETMVTHTACMFLVVAGHRPVDALFALTVGEVHLETEGGMALFRDKVHDAAHDPRFAALAPCLVRQITKYLEHLHGLVAIQPRLESHVRAVLAGLKPLLFGINRDGNPMPLAMATWRKSLPEGWTQQPLNWGRTWIRTRGVEAGLSPEWASVQLGHLEAVGYPFSNASPTAPTAAIGMIAPHLEALARSMGWRVRSGLPTNAEAKGIRDLPPLQSWSTVVADHQADAQAQIRQWRKGQLAEIATYRQQAEQDVLSHRILIERGIDKAFRDQVEGRTVQPLQREEAEALRDMLFEAADDDVALGIARSRALRRILRRVNKALGITGQDPGALGTFRRPLDNAFIPGMMHAVRQVDALRRHAAALGAAGPGDWRDFPRACARVAYVLAVFGYMDDPEQIEGVIRHRESYSGPANLSDVVLVPWGDRPEQVVALRNLAAVALARLARRYVGQSMPDRETLSAALAEFLPGWALPTGRTRPSGLLVMLCETVGVANRFELSPAARFALSTESGATNACITDQLALIDGDPVGTIPRMELHDGADVDIESAGVLPSVIGAKGSARSQYLALCRTLPSTGNTLVLPLTQGTVPASQLFQVGTRRRVIAEVDALLSQTRPESVLRPVVRMLAMWLCKMLVEGTAAQRNPADKTLYTYLTRIGGTLVELLGNSSLADLDDVELSEAYQAAVLAGGSNRAQAASAILEFHRCSQRHFDMPDVDLDEVRSHLRNSTQSVDARLILPQERVAILDNALARARDGTGRTPDDVRVYRQAAVALPLYAWGGARCAEVLGLRLGDVWFVGEQAGIRVRRNRSRRLKTAAARRTLLFDSTCQLGVSHALEWIGIDGLRSAPWQRARAYIFSPSGEPMAAEGRDAIARACVELVRDVTSRGRERLHRLRHLVAFERTMPLLLDDADSVWLQSCGIAVSTSPGAQVILPRDLMERVVTLGHVDWRTTVRSYLHLPWLMRSRQDRALAETYMKRREIAFAMGVSLPAVDKITQQTKHLAPALMWLAHVRTTRRLPLAPVPKDPVGETVRTRWTSREIDALFRMADRLGGLESAARVYGATAADVAEIRRRVSLVERRMGKALFRNQETHELQNGPSRVLKRQDHAMLDAFLSWFDALLLDERTGVLQLLESIVDIMSAFDRDGIEGEAAALDGLARAWEQAVPKRVRLEITNTDHAHAKLRAWRCHDTGGLADSGEDARLDGVVRRAVATAWIAGRLGAIENPAN
ncbi:hypothetical protein ACW7G0_10955 [Lysobacter sp. A286]